MYANAVGFAMYTIEVNGHPIILITKNMYSSAEWSNKAKNIKYFWIKSNS
jgi:hypothetical protein